MPSRSNSNVTVYYQEIRQSVEEGGGHRAVVTAREAAEAEAMAREFCASIFRL